MNPLVVKPGETIQGLGIDFSGRLVLGETISQVSVAITSGSGLVIASQSANGTSAVAAVSVPADQPDGDHVVTYTVTGTAGSVRKGSRSVWVRAVSE